MSWHIFHERELDDEEKKERLSGLYLEVRQKWNDMRVRKDADTETLKFLVHLMDELEAL